MVGGARARHWQRHRRGGEAEVRRCGKEGAKLEAAQRRGMKGSSGAFSMSAVSSAGRPGSVDNVSAWLRTLTGHGHGHGGSTGAGAARLLGVVLAAGAVALAPLGGSGHGADATCSSRRGSSRPMCCEATLKRCA